MKLPNLLVIYDTEFTAWPGSNERGWSQPWENRELIQLAAIKVQVSDCGVTTLASFNELIKPVKNPVLSDYIVDLTGITQDMVDNLGVDFSSALALFKQFSDDGTIPCVAWGNDSDVVRENCQLFDMPYPRFNGGFGDLHRLAKVHDLPGVGKCSGELASFLGLELEGKNHNALFDVRSIVLALNHWLSSGNLTVETLQSAIDSR